MSSGIVVEFVNRRMRLLHPSGQVDEYDTAHLQRLADEVDGQIADLLALKQLVLADLDKTALAVEAKTP